MKKWFKAITQPEESYSKWYFAPKVDITTYELACIYACISGYRAPKNGVMILDATWATLHPNIKRHFGTEPTK